MVGPMKNYGIEVRLSDIRGRGVFATAAFDVGDEIEECPLLLAGEGDDKLWAKTVAGSYRYPNVPTEGQSAIFLGFGSIYNHADDPTAWFEKLPERCSVRIVARKKIARGDEITLRYSGDKKAMQKWFDSQEDDHLLGYGTEIER